MVSNDNNVLTIEIFNAGIAELKNELKSDIQELKNEVRTLDKNVAVNSAKIEMLQHTFYWGFGIMAIVVALVPYLKREKSEKKDPELTEKKVQSMIDVALARALSVK